MDTLKLELGERATRQWIRDQLFARLDPDAAHEIAGWADGLAREGGHCHDLAAVIAFIDATDASEHVKEDARAVYRILAQAEAQVHGCPVEQTHFHEVGDVEAVANVLAICRAFEALAPGEVISTPVQVGSGQVRCAHGLLDIPAPATAAILARGIPVAGERLAGERCTPTSAAVILHFVDRFE